MPAKPWRDWIAETAAVNDKLRGFKNPNQLLVDIGAATLEAYHNIAADHQRENRDGGLTPEGDFPCLLADLLHLADAQGWDFTAMLKEGRRCYAEELRHARETAREYMASPWTDRRPVDVAPLVHMDPTDMRGLPMPKKKKMVNAAQKR